jgi:hypothetical protein
LTGCHVTSQYSAGCFPPRAPRTRPITYYWDNGLDPPAWMIAQAPEARKGFGKLIGWISGEDRSKHGGSEGQPDGLRQRTGKVGGPLRAAESLAANNAHDASPAEYMLPY